jgi:hypothetical protein
VQRLGYDARPIFGTEQTVIAAIGDERTHHTLESLSFLPEVEQVMRVQKRYKLVRPRVASDGFGGECRRAPRRRGEVHDDGRPVLGGK